jgi:hypothetical protein
MKIGDFLIQGGNILKNPRATKVVAITKDQICLEILQPSDSGRKTYHYMTGKAVEKAEKVSKKTKVDIWKID